MGTADFVIMIGWGCCVIAAGFCLGLWYGEHLEDREEKRERRRSPEKRREDYGLDE